MTSWIRYFKRPADTQCDLGVALAVIADTSFNHHDGSSRRALGLVRPGPHGTTSLFAALEVATGRGTERCYHKHTNKEFLAFLKRVAAEYPEGAAHRG
jgi:hypothetical protein